MDYKSALFLVVCLSVQNYCNSQKFISFRVNYGLGLNENNLNDGDISTFDEELGLLSIESVNYSYGAGASVDLSFGKYLSNDFYLKPSFTYKFRDEKKYSQEIFGATTQILHSGRFISASFQIGLEKKILKKSFFYLEFGPLVNISSNYSIAKDVENSFNDVYRGEIYFGGISFGGETSAGLRREISDKVSLSLSISSLFFSYSPKKAEVVDYLIDGVDELGRLNDSERYIEFRKRIEQFPINGQVPEDMPRQELERNISYSTVRIGLGVFIKI